MTLPTLLLLISPHHHRRGRLEVPRRAHCRRCYGSRRVNSGQRHSHGCVTTNSTFCPSSSITTDTAPGAVCFADPAGQALGPNVLITTHLPHLPWSITVKKAPSCRLHPRRAPPFLLEKHACLLRSLHTSPCSSAPHAALEIFCSSFHPVDRGQRYLPSTQQNGRRIAISLSQTPPASPAFKSRLSLPRACSRILDLLQCPRFLEVLRLMRGPESDDSDPESDNSILIKSYS